MAFPTQSIDLNTVFSAHGREYLKRTPTDNFYKGNPALAMMKKKSKKLSGGRYFIEPILQGGEPVGGSYGRAEALPTTPADPVTEAVYEASFYGEPVTIFYQDEVRAGGAGAMFDYVETRVEDSRLKLDRKLAGHLLASSQAKSTDILPLSSHISTSATLGGIAPGTYTWWVAQADSSVVFSSGGLDALRNIINDASFGGIKRPDVIVMTQSIWESYVDLVEGAGSLNYSPGGAAGRKGDLGFPVVSYQGIDVIWDRNQISGRIDLINHDGLYLAEQEGGAWKMGDFAPLHVNGQQGRIAYIRWCGQTITRHRQSQATITSVT